MRNGRIFPSTWIPSRPNEGAPWEISLLSQNYQDLGIVNRDNVSQHDTWRSTLQIPEWSCMATSKRSLTLDPDKQEGSKDFKRFTLRALSYQENYISINLLIFYVYFLSCVVIFSSIIHSLPIFQNVSEVNW